MKDYELKDHEMKQVLDGYFAFKIGDTVRLKGSLAGDLVQSGGMFPFGGRDASPAYVGCTGIIVERYLQQCHGGLQRSYKVAFVQPDGNVRLPVDVNSLVPEIVLEPCRSWREIHDADVAKANAEAEAAKAKKAEREAAAREAAAAGMTEAEARLSEALRKSPKGGHIG